MRITNKKIIIPLTTILFVWLVVLVSCRKDELQAKQYFDASINNEVKALSPDNVNIRKGITILAGYTNEADVKSAVVITVNGNKNGKYRQVYDYITGVSVTECGLTYKILSRKVRHGDSDYFVSYEGDVVIENIDYSSKTITGSYDFKVRAIPDTEKKQTISGKFINVSFK